MNLSNLSISDFSNIDQNLSDRIFSSLTPNNLIGKGAVGKVYVVDQKYVVKEIIPCEADPNSGLYDYCLDILKIKDEIPNIPGGNGKKRYILPNLFSEILIGMILGEMKETLSFTKTIGSILLESKNEVKIYIVMEYNKPLLQNKKINSELNINGNQLLNLLFQISHALFTAQQKYKFTHYDLHSENVLWSSWDDEENYINYPLPKFDSKFLLKAEAIYKISDFGLARLENEKTMVTPSIDTFPQKTYGEFSPSYDILSFLGSICIDYKYRVAFDPLFSENRDVYRFMLIFLLWVLNDKEIKLMDDLTKTRDMIGNKYYTSITSKPNIFTFRPKTKDNFIEYSKSKSMASIVVFLARMLIRSNQAYISNKSSNEIYNLEKLNNFQIYSKVLLYEPNIPKVNKGVNYIETKIDNSIYLRSYQILTKAHPKSYNFTLSDKQIEYCPYQEHYLTAIFVKPNCLKDYKFEFSCCKLDPANYLVDNFKTGFAINGGFFDIKGDYLPIGPYKDDYFQTYKHKIPEEYKDVFGYLLLKDNKLTISKTVTDEKVLTTGPMLIENGKIVFNPHENRFSCSDSKHAGNTLLEESEKEITLSGHYDYSLSNNSCSRDYIPDVQTYPRCDKINPGELSHANNPNPRSALCFLDDGTYVFLAIEGRGNRGVGMDLYTLASSIMVSLPNVVSSINLDGGRSSTLAWRSSIEPKTVYISNTDRNYVYPVGNIISLLKK